MHVDEAIATRRTHKVYDGTPVSAETMRALIEAGTWAPNHKYTEPWRFTVLLGAAMPKLADAVCDALEQMRKPDSAAEMKLHTKKRKFQRRAREAGAILVVTYVASPEDPVLDREDYAATACAIQNVQLAATARGLVCQWSTSGVFNKPSVRAHLQLPDEEALVGVVFIGTPVQALEGRRHKPIDAITRWVGA